MNAAELTKRISNNPLWLAGKSLCDKKEIDEHGRSYYCRVYVPKEVEAPVMKLGPYTDPNLLYLQYCKGVQRGVIQSNFKHGPEIYAILELKQGYVAVTKKYNTVPYGEKLTRSKYQDLLNPFTEWLRSQGYKVQRSEWGTNDKIFKASAKEKTRSFHMGYDLHNDNIMWDSKEEKLIIIDALAGHFNYPKGTLL